MQRKKKSMVPSVAQSAHKRNNSGSNGKTKIQNLFGNPFVKEQPSKEVSIVLQGRKNSRNPKGSIEGRRK